MQISPSYRRWVALSLALFFVTAWSLKTMHGFLLHADHHDRPVCSAEHDQAAQHIHDTRYAADGCTLCAFVLAVSTLPSVRVIVEPKLTRPAEKISTHYQSPTTCIWGSSIPARGPPAS